MRVARSARESQSVSRVVQVHVQVHTGNGRVVLEELETRGAGATRRTRSAKHVGSGDRLLASSELNERSASEGRVGACGMSFLTHLRVERVAVVAARRPPRDDLCYLDTP